MVNAPIQIKDEENPTVKSDADENKQVKNIFKRMHTKAPVTAAAMVQPNMPNMAQSDSDSDSDPDDEFM